MAGDWSFLEASSLTSLALRLGGSKLSSMGGNLSGWLPCSEHPKSLQSCPTLWNPMDIAHQAPLSVGFSRQEYWSGLPCPPPGDLRGPGIESESLRSPALAGRFFTTPTPW